ncbi:hypothetical protein [Paraburkholderia graminis]|uniref:hypothetical protein n=1 Tax=Paraburkholderia graminis TaxID=60548 RepID=UPI0031DC21B0
MFNQLYLVGQPAVQANGDIFSVAFDGSRAVKMDAPPCFVPSVKTDQRYQIDGALSLSSICVRCKPVQRCLDIALTWPSESQQLFCQRRFAVSANRGVKEFRRRQRQNPAVGTLTLLPNALCSQSKEDIWMDSVQSNGARSVGRDPVELEAAFALRAKKACCCEQRQATVWRT